MKQTPSAWLLLSLLIVPSLYGCAGTRARENPLLVQPLAELPPASPRALQLERLLSAELAMALNLPQQALPYYLAAAQHSPDPRLAHQAAQLALENNEADTLIAAAKRWQELQADDPLPRQALALGYLLKGDSDEATALLRQLLEQQDAASRDSSLRALSEWLETQETAAEYRLHVLQGLQSTYADSPWPALSKARIMTAENRHSDALETLQHSRNNHPDNNDMLLLQSRLLFRLGQPQQALKLLADAVQKQPQSTALRIAYARLLTNTEQPQQAATQLRWLQQHHPQQSQLQLTIALLFLDADLPDDAELLLQKLLRRGELVNQVLFSLGLVAENRQQYQQAISYYLRVTEPQRALEAQLRVMQALSRLNHLDKARAHAQRLRDIHADAGIQSRIYQVEAQLLEQAQQFDAAYSLLSEALSLHPDNLDLLYMRGLLAEKNSRPDLLEQDMMAILDQQPEHAQALNALGYTLADHRQRLAQAQRYIEQAIALMPNEPAIIDSLGWVHYRRGNNHEALHHLEQAWNLSKDPEIGAHLGEVLWVTGERERAQEIWQKILGELPEGSAVRQHILQFSE